jgi:hypothetical protein
MERRTLDLRQFLGAVNLRDFAQMVGAELRLIATSVRLAFESLPRLPAGPLVFLVGMLMVLLRSVLLALVVVVFGAGITIITLVRTVTGSRRGADGEPD